MSRSTPDLTLERALHAAGVATFIAGLDEAGRGALAGPVVAAAVILPVTDGAIATVLAGVTDSKQLSASARERASGLIRRHALAYGIGSTPANAIDHLGIISATKAAMRAALAQLAPAADYLLIDGRLRLQDPALPQQSLIRGDGRSLSIAAASILAKVSRDRQMVALDRIYPQYGFAQHKGYGTPAHLAALRDHGPTPVHRHSFSPLRPRLVDG